MKEFMEHEQGKNRREQPGEGQAGRPGVQPGSGPVNPPDVQLNEAFVTGGVICCIGQGILNYAGSIGLEKDAAGAWCSVALVLASVILTGLNIFPQIAKWGGAGALVPITGFANSVAAAAIEYQKEGQVFGIGCKIFTIAGPVILYGIFTSWGLGLIYWILGLAGVF